MATQTAADEANKRSGETLTPTIVGTERAPTAPVPAQP
jgi:hypothetical protein